MAKSVGEIRFSVKNKIGALSEVAAVLRKQKVNILHVTAWCEGSKGCFNMVTNDNARARKALKTAGIKTAEVKILVLNLRNKVGALERVARKLAKAKVDITCLAATTGGARASVLINTKNNAKARKVV